VAPHDQVAAIEAEHARLALERRGVLADVALADELGEPREPVPHLGSPAVEPLGERLAVEDLLVDRRVDEPRLGRRAGGRAVRVGELAPQPLHVGRPEHDPPLGRRGRGHGDGDVAAGDEDARAEQQEMECRRARDAGEGLHYPFGRRRRPESCHRRVCSARKRPLAIRSVVE
jgi:hypothetical protein